MTEPKLIRAVIVDDERRGREALEALLDKHCDNVEIVAYADSPVTGAEQIRKHKPDLVFLDIEMPGGNGFDLLNRTRDLNFDVIFTTAYSHYAIKAIRFSALDYLLKPINPDELKEAVARVHPRDGNESQGRKKMDALLENIHDSSKARKIVIPGSEGANYLFLDEIIRCSADGNYTNIHLTSGKKILVAKTLKDYEEMLTEEDFCRIHHGHLVNLRHIKKYIKGEGGQVEMSDGTVVEVSRRKKHEFIDRLNAGKKA